MNKSKIKHAEIKFTFDQNEEPKARIKKIYEDGSKLEEDGIQSFENGKTLLEDLTDNPIYVPKPSIETPNNSNE